MSLKAVIFDVDGTLADTEEAHRNAFNASFRKFGLPWVWHVALYRELLAIAGGKERIRHYCEQFAPHFLDSSRADEIIVSLHADKTRRYAELVASGDVSVRPGVLRLIRTLREAGIRLAIATTTSRSNVDALLASSLNTLPPDTFEVIGAAEQSASKKPAPAIYHWVLKQLALEPENCLAIEDSRNGVLAAQAAGIPTLVTECAWTVGEQYADVLAVLSDLGEPGRPHEMVQGPADAIGYVDAVVLRRWHAAGRAMPSRALA